MNADQPAVADAVTMAVGIGPSGEELARTRLAVMRELQVSLSGSRTALLALDLAGIEQGTREQADLSRRLACEIAREKTWLASPRRHPVIAIEISATEKILETKIKGELRQSERRVLDALRLQLALLARARAKLRLLSNILAGPSAIYGPPPGFDFSRGGQI